MRGKEKCKALKEIRRQIAENNDIEYAVSECTYQGECKGTCPKCEAELRYLERELAIRQSLGKAVVIAGISAGICAPMTACNPIEMISDVINEVQNIGATEGVAQPPEQIEGDVQIIEPSEVELDGMPVEEEIMGMEGPNPDLIENSEEDSTLTHYPNSEYNPEELAGEVPLAPSSEEDIKIDEYFLEGDVVIDPEYSDEK